jgi:hypothetical protein
MNDLQKENLKNYIKEVLRKEVTKVRDIAKTRPEMVDKFLDLVEKSMRLDLENSPYEFFKLIENSSELFSESIFNYIKSTNRYYEKILVHGIKDIYKPDTIIEMVINYLRKEIKLNKNIFKKIINIMTDAGVLLHNGDTYLFYSDEDNDQTVVKNQWLIHFTSLRDMQSIVGSGFKMGVENPENLGYTQIYLSKRREQNKLKDSVYVFSYKVEDLLNSKININKYQYSRNAVLFRSGGIELYHESDKEKQVISYSDDATNIVGIIRYEINGNPYWTPYTLGLAINSKIPSINKNKNLPEFNSFIKCVNWIIQNYDQYKNILSVR